MLGPLLLMLFNNDLKDKNLLGLQMIKKYVEKWVMKKKRRYCREIYKECSDGHRTGKCCSIWTSALLCIWTVGHEKQVLI